MIKEKRPMLVTFIGDISVLIGLIGIFGFLGLMFPGLLGRTGILITIDESFTGYSLNVLSILFFLLCGVGFLKLKKWAFISLAAYNAVIIIFHIYRVVTGHHQDLYDIAVHFVVLATITNTKKYFYNENTASA